MAEFRILLLCGIMALAIGSGRAAETPAASAAPAGANASRSAKAPDAAGHPPAAGEDFTLPDLHGKALHLQEMRGKITVLNFWAFWCDTWKEELPHLKDLAHEQTARNFRLIAISVDGTRLQTFLDQTGGEIGFPVLLDTGGKVSRSYRVVHVPTVLILDAAGRIRYIKSGYPGNQAILTELRLLQSEQAGEAVSRTAGQANRQPIYSRNSVPIFNKE